MDSIIISTKNDVTRFTYIDGKWNLETIYKITNDLQKTMDLEEKNAINSLTRKEEKNAINSLFFSEHTNKILSESMKKAKQPPVGHVEDDKNIITLKPKAKARVSKPRKKLVEVEDKIIVE